MYKRRPTWTDKYNNYPSQTKVFIHWSTKASAYTIKFENTKNWDKMQIFIQYLKNLPNTDRDYDPDNKIWYLIEKHLVGFKQMLEMIPEYFTIDFQDKPTGQPTAMFVPVDVYLDKFKSLTGEDVKGVEYDKAKKIYRRMCMKYHPDITKSSEPMTTINQIWTALELNYFKTRKEVECVGE